MNSAVPNAEVAVEHSTNRIRGVALQNSIIAITLHRSKQIRIPGEADVAVGAKQRAGAF